MVSKVMAQLQLAALYESSQQPTEAKQIYEQIVKENPKTETESMAKERLAGDEVNLFLRQLEPGLAKPRATEIVFATPPNARAAKEPASYLPHVLCVSHSDQ